jgi:hypothetical protein
MAIGRTLATPTLRDCYSFFCMCQKGPLQKGAPRVRNGTPGATGRQGEKDAAGNGAHFRFGPAACPEGLKAYYPEANVLTPLGYHDKQSGTPSYKSVPVRIHRAG